MTLNYRAFLVFLISIYSLHLSAQYQFPFRIDNYAGMQAGILNPAGTLTQKPSWEVDIVSGGLFFENSFAYIQNTNTIKLLTSKSNIVPASQISNEHPPKPGDLIYDFYNNTNSKYLIQNAFVGFPGFMMRINGNQRIGLFANTRVAFSGTGFPHPLDYYHFDATPFYVKIPADKFTVAGMAWSEIGGHYAYSIEHGNGIHGFGVNVKYLMGHEGFFFRNEEPTFVTQMLGDTFKLDHLKANYAFTTSNLEANQKKQLKFNGSGVAIDLGYTYTIDADEGYQWKFMAGVNDLGWVNINKNAEQHQLTTSDSVFIYQNKYSDSSSIIAKTRLLSTDVLGNPTASLVKDNFSIGTPARVNLMAEYRFIPSLYVAGVALFDLPLAHRKVSMGNVISIVPGYESKWLSASLPLSLYQFSEMYVGLNLRLGFLTIGTTNLMSLIADNDHYTGTDFYFAIQLHSLSFGDGEYAIGRKKISKKKVKCYEFQLCYK